MPGRKPYAYSFLWERNTSGVMLDRKPFAKSFLSGMKPQCFSRVGNSLQIVSRPAGDKGISSEWETLCEKFPVWHEAAAFQQSRKLFANSFLCGMKQQCFNRAGNPSPLVSCAA